MLRQMKQLISIDIKIGNLMFQKKIGFSDLFWRKINFI